MKNIKFLNKIFNIKEKVSIPAIELEDWLDEYSANEFASINKKIEMLLEKANEDISNVKKYLKILDSSKLTYKVNIREKHVIEGNKSSYINKVESFLEKLILPELKLAILREFCEEFFERLNTLNESTAKGYYLLKNYFGDDIYNVAKAIKTLEKSMIGINDNVNKGKVLELENLYEKTRELNESIIKDDGLDTSIAELSEEIDSLKDKERQIIEKMNDLKLSREFKRFNDLEKEKENINMEISKINSDLSNQLSILEKPLRKTYHESKDAKKIDNFFRNPGEELIKDESDQILDLIEGINMDFVEEKKKEKTKNILEAITKEFLDQARQEMVKKCDKKKELNTIIEKMTVTMDYKEQEYQLEHIQAKLKSYDKDFEKLIGQKNRLNIEKMGRQLESQFMDTTGIEFEIIPREES